MSFLHKRKMDILNGNIMQQIMLFIFPVLVGYLLEQVYAAVDSMILGSISKNALAAIGSANTIINVVKNFISGMLAAITILVAQNYGRGSFERVKQVIRTGMFVAVVGGGILAILVVSLEPILLKLMSTPTELLKDAKTYIIFYMASIIFYFIYNAGVSILRATGDSKRPLYFIILNCVIKILLDLLFVYVFKLEVIGTCIATLLSFMICAIAILIIFGLTDDNYHYTLKEFGFESSTLSQLIKIGLPAGFQSSLFAIANLCIQVRINSYGTDTMAAYSAFNSIDNYFWCLSNSLSAAVMTIAGQNYGNKNIKRVKKTAVCGIIVDAAFGLAVALVIFLFEEPFVRLYTSDQNVVDITMRMLRVNVEYYFVYGLVESLSATLKSIGSVMQPLYICLIFICGLRLGYLFFVPCASPENVLYCFPISWAVTGAAFVVAFMLNKKLKENSTN